MPIPRGLLAVALVLVAGSVAHATPRYSAIVGQDCNLCHINPTGGGLRDPYSSQYLLPTRLAMQIGGRSDEAIANPQISDDLVVGADLRTMWLWQENKDAGNNFRAMQGSLYFALGLGDPRYKIYVHQEFGQRDVNVEAFGLAYILPANGYVKAGRIVPAFGWKVADHRAFARRDFVFLPQFPPHSDTGVEIGLYPADFTFEASVTNGQFQSPVDANDSVALAGRTSWKWTREPFHVVVGGSWYHNEAVNEDLDAVGPLAAARWGRLRWFGEADWTRREAAPVETSPTVWGFVTSNELSLQLVQGLDVVATYDFYDPDTDLETGAAHRIGVGMDALARSFVHLSAKVNLFSFDNGATVESIFEPGSTDGTVDGFTQAELTVHFLY
ncbi:MAG: hypothetical protein ACT4PE_10510 [Candidatus Eiseniibacteriota bacterium]